MNLEKIAVGALSALARHEGKKIYKKQGYAEKPASAKPIRMQNPADDGFRCGFASRITMPKNIHAHPYYLAGHRTGKTVAGILDPLTVSALWLDCKDGGGMVVIGADVVGIANMEIAQIRDALQDFCRETGCKSISILCSHNHAGIDTLGYWGKAIIGPIPGNGKDPEYMALLTENMRACCYEAFKTRKEGKLYTGSIRVPDAVFRKRKPIVARDVLSRIRFVPDDGSEETWWLNFGAHPNTMGGDNQMISAEYPGYLRKAIQNVKKTNVLFGVGPILAVDPGEWSEDVYECARLEGEALAKAAFSIENDTPLSPEIVVVRQPFLAPVENPVLALMAIIKTVNYKKAASRDSSLGLALCTEMTYIRIGTQQILMLPGEAAPEFAFGGYSSAETSATGLGPEVNAKPLSAVADDDNLIVFGLANDMVGYMVPPNDFILNENGPYLDTANDRFGERHYHETNSLSPKMTQIVSDTFAGILEHID